MLISKFFHQGFSFVGIENFEIWNWIWLDIPSKVYLENLCIIVSVALGIFSGRLTEKSRHDFHFGFSLFPS